jgi:hypothetical protein
MKKRKRESAFRRTVGRFSNFRFSVSKIAGLVAGVSVFMFAAVGLLNNSLMDADAQQVSAEILDAADAFVSLEIVNSSQCPNSTTFSLPVEPNARLGGNITSDCVTVVIDTSRVTGYLLTIRGDGDGTLAKTTGDPYALNPLTSATSTAPETLSVDTWGWALAGFDGFDSAYVSEVSNTLNFSQSRWAGIPSADQIIVQPSDGSPLNELIASFDFFFAAAADQSTPKGTYTGAVVFTVSSEGLGVLDDAVTVTTDPAMIPVAYVGSASGPVWVKADTTNSGMPNTTNANGGTFNWYDYDSKIWANSVTVSANRATYQAAAPGTVINPADVVGYWVYIPRFRYQTWTYQWRGDNFPHAINIEFENCASDSTGVCTNPSYTKQTVDMLSTTSPGGWLTHPAFTFNGKELNGIWVGKHPFTGTTSAPTMLPDQNPIVSQTIGSLQTTAQSMVGMASHGLTSANSDVRIFNNAHWGAVAYLSQSLYGICTNLNCTTDGLPATALSPANGQKVHNNGVGNSATTRFTGYGGGGNPDANNIARTSDNLWFTTNGMLASSNGNPTGVYDLAGCVWEYNLTVLDSATLNSATSGISAFDPKYMIAYTRPPLTGTNTDLFNGLYNFTSTFKLAIGHSLFETGGGTTTSSMWNGDSSFALASTAPWSSRGGGSGYGATAGVFATVNITGIAHANGGARPLMTMP